MDENGGLGDQTEDGDDSTIALFLALYLLVLAFFIILVTISSVEEVRSRAVMDSLTSTFATLVPPTTDLTAFTTLEGEVVAGQAFQEEVTKIFSSSIQVIEIDVVQPGRTSRVKLDSDALFVSGETTIRPALLPMIDRIVAAVSNRPPGLRYDLEFVIGSPYAADESLPIGQTLEMARAGAFARNIISRGAPPESVAIGMQPGTADKVHIWFYVRGIDEMKLRFEEADRTTRERSAPEETAK